MTKLEKHSNMLFAIVFWIIAIAELIGFLGGRNWCLAVAIVAGFLSRTFFNETKQKHERYIQNNNA